MGTLFSDNAIFAILKENVGWATIETGEKGLRTRGFSWIFTQSDPTRTACPAWFPNTWRFWWSLATAGAGGWL